MNAARILTVVAVVLSVVVVPRASASVAVGSKKFTESVVLGEALTLALERAGVPAAHRRELGGSRVLFNALGAGELDAYVEYTGTLTRELLAERLDAGAPLERVAGVLAEDGLRISRPLGFDNTYALGMTEARARALSLTRISQLTEHPQLRFAVSNEFLDRADGWPGLVRRYGLGRANVRGMDHDLAYRALAGDRVDVIDVYTTDAEIAHYGLRILKDDRDYFSAYDAVVLYRADLDTRHGSAWRDVLARFEGAIDAARMSALNARVKIGRESERTVAADLVGDDAVDTATPRLLSRLAARSIEHLALVVTSLGAAIVLAVPLGIVAAARPAAGSWILSACGIVQTIPSLALLVFMIPLLGIGGPPAVAALFLYSLLPESVRLFPVTCLGKPRQNVPLQHLRGS